ncbi:MAG: histidine kinase [Denitrovibrio sp.]|nr:MAG: histidine kinase [Denitrovibrio sp.]
MKLTAKLIFSITIVSIVIISATINFFWVSQRQLLLQQAHAQAKTLFEMLVVTRQWVAENRDSIKPVPAVATKELSEYAKVMTDFRFHITSDILINPENAPDDFEKDAMAMFRKDAREYSEITTVKKEKYYRYMAPLYVNEACLECHEYQGYKSGDLRGGISIMLPLKDLEQALAQNNRNYYMIAFLSFIGILVTMTMLMKALVLKNVDKLTAAASSYKTGDFSEKLVMKTSDEIQELAEAFEIMRQSIVENEDRLKEELKRVTGQYQTVMEELKERNKELKSVNLFKTDILDSLSHELRTPLTKIIAFSNLLMQENVESDTEVKSKSLDAINRSAKLLNTLFNEIITLSRLESKQYTYHFIPVEIYKLTSEIIELFEKEISDKELDVTIEMPKDIVICVDGESFRHVITNLLTNAIKFSTPGGKINFSYYIEGDYKVLEVKDTGVGIPEDEIGKITERFFRGSNVKREYSGTGLGLSIVNRIIDGHNGKFEIKSSLGQGSVFKLLIPIDLECSKNLESDEE